jgi:L-malate glycosyltransferase
MIKSTTHQGAMSNRVETASRRLRICVVAPSLEIYGGQSIQAARLVKGLNQEAEIMADWLPHNPRLPGPLHLLQRVKYVRTVVTEFTYLLLLLTKLWRYDVIHVFSASYFSFLLAPTPAILISKLFGKPVILNYHSGEADDHLRRWRSAMPVCRMADRVIVPSGFLVDVFGRYGVRAEAIFNTVELDKFSFHDRGALRPIILSNRNFEANYNVATTLRAFEAIQQRIPDAKLFVAGDGGERGQLQALSRELGLKNVEFTGPIAPDQMPALYDRADIFINSSVVDNMPLSIIEAFACGLAVATTGAGGIPRIVTHDRNGKLVAPGDHQALARAVLSLLEDNAAATRLIENARSDSLLYTWVSVKSEWLTLYRDLARKSQ